MKHCIIAKFNESAADKQAALAQVRALLSGAEPIEGVRGITIHENCVARDNRYDLMIVVEMEKAALPNWDASGFITSGRSSSAGCSKRKRFLITRRKADKPFRSFTA